MRKYDIYLYDDCDVLKNLLNIKNESKLNLAEAELSRANMMILYEKGFSDFSVKGIFEIHRTLFGDIYDWAGKPRIINIQKREEILAGRSVWYSNDDNIESDLEKVWDNINSIDWKHLSRQEFAKNIAHLFSAIWQVHPFREGNTRTVVMLMTFFVEHYGYYFDQDLMSASAGYVRNAFVLASLGEYSEYEHLEKILLDAICTEPNNVLENMDAEKKKNNEKYEKYYTKEYKPTPHEYVEKINLK